MKWEYQLMRDMLERATLYLSVPTFENHKTGAMLRQAATVMTDWDRKIFDMEIEAKKSNEAVAEIERLRKHRDVLAREVGELRLKHQSAKFAIEQLMNEIAVLKGRK